jgi:hypothetical protein
MGDALMESEKEPGRDWLGIVSLLWFGVSPVCLMMGLVFTAFYDSSLDPKIGPGEGIGLLDQLLLGSILTFPVIGFLCSLGIRFLKKKNRRVATFLAFLPLLPLTAVLAIFAWQ